MKQARDPAAIRGALDARGLTRRELAKLADISLGTVGFVLGGAPCSPDIARRIARTLRRPVDELFVASTSSSKQRPVPERAAG